MWLVIYPDAPDGLVYDPLERPPFGLVEIKCPNAVSYIDCRYLRADHGIYKLKESHPYYWQVQGQLLITGMEWCDFVICAHDDMFVQRIYRDTSVSVLTKQVYARFYKHVFLFCQVIWLKYFFTILHLLTISFQIMYVQWIIWWAYSKLKTKMISFKWLQYIHTVYTL